METLKLQERRTSLHGTNPLNPFATSTFSSYLLEINFKCLQVHTVTKSENDLLPICC